MKKKLKFLIILIIASITLINCGKSREIKTEIIIEKLQFVESQKFRLQHELESIKYRAFQKDALLLEKIENQISDKEILKKYKEIFNDIFSDQEINETYRFLNSTAYGKLFHSKKIYDRVNTKFQKTYNEIENIKKSLERSVESESIEDIIEIVEKPQKQFQKTKIDRANGFYEVINHNSSTENVSLVEEPSITFTDILKVEKKFNTKINKFEINIILTKKGAQKFYLLTKKNIGKSIALVFEKTIVSMPKVYSEITKGKITINTDLSEKEIDLILENLK